MSIGIATSSPAWSIPGYLEVRNDHLTVNGVDTLELVKEFNSPLFVFSEPRIRDNIKRLQLAADAVDRPIKFCYASKANSNMAILKVVLESGIDIEVNSGGELFKALRIGFRPDQIIFNGTSKSDDELVQASTRSMLIRFMRSISSNSRSSGCGRVVKKSLRRESRCVSYLRSARAHISDYRPRC
jgi:hypothetical protein